MHPASDNPTFSAPANPSPTTALVFTAAEIATALGKKRSNVARLLADVPAAGVKVASGNEARAWTVSQLPASLRAGLETLTRKLGCQSADIALRQCCAPWQPEIPLVECDPSAIECARLLRDAMRQPLLRQNAPGLTAAEREARALEDYRKAFGREITARHWRDLFARTLRRAGSTPNFDTLEIYLPERLKRKDAMQAAQSTATANSTDARLREFISAFGDVSNPTPRERESLWTQAMEETQSLIDSGETFNRAGRIVRAALRKFAPFLAASSEALQKAFARKLAAWHATGGAAQSMTDGRRNNTGNHDGFELPQEDVDLLTHLAVWQSHGSIAAAWKQAHARKQLSAHTAARYPLTATAHVPHKVREAIGPEVELFMLMKRGRRNVDEITPHVSRTFDGLFSCQIYQGDDFTMPVYFYVPDGRDWFNLMRGQVLLFIDFRSSKIVGWTLIPEPQYSSLAIWTQLKGIFTEHGIPDLLYFERGIWERSKILTGGRNGDPSTAEVVQGLGELGIKFKHAIRPRSKTVERIGGLVQDFMEGEPGYCGRDERRDLPAHTKEILQRVRSRKVHPSTCLYSFEQWNARLGEIIAQYNATPQQGKQLGGLSPNQAFDQFMQPDKERRHSDLELEFLLTHKEEREVRPGQSIKFTVGKNVFRYYGPELAPFMGRRVIAAFDPQRPGHLIVTDMKKSHLELVPLAKEVSAAADLLGEDARQNLAHELSRAAGQMTHLRARYNTVKSTLPMRHPEVGSFGGLVAGARVQHLRKKADEREQTSQRTVRAARKAGVYVPPAQRVRENTPNELRELNDYLSLPNGEEASKS